MPRTEQAVTTEDDTPDFPEGANTYVWSGAGGFRCGNAEDYADDLPDDVELSPVPARGRDEERMPTVVFDPGDELPEALARDIWESFNDRVAVFDAAGDRVGSPGEREDAAAVKRWRMRREAEAAADQ